MALQEDAAVVSVDADLDADLNDIFGDSSDDEEFLGFPVSDSSDSDSDDDTALPSTWQVVLPEEDVASNAWLPHVLEKKPGSNLANTDVETVQPVDTFCALIDDDIIDNMVMETNRYAKQRLDQLGDRFPRSRLRQWREANRQEMLVFIMLILAMGTVQQPEIVDHWTDHWLFATPGFTKVMARNRFQLLVSCLHFVNNEDADRRDPLFKIRRFIDAVVANFRQAYTPLREVSIDEQMVAYKGRLSFKQYMPAKPIKWGMKAFVLAESKTGYVCDWHLYTGKDQATDDNDSRGKGERVVCSLVRSLQPGHVVYMDNYYSSPSLFSSLKEKQLGAVGTVRVNRRGLPTEIKTKQKKNMPTRHWRKGNMLALSWFDKKQVNMLSTVHTAMFQDVSIRDRRSATGSRQVKKPTSVAAYNTFMGGVDKADQLVSYYGFPHRHKRWYLSIFHQLTELCLTNAMILYEDIKGTPVHLKQFRAELLDGILRRTEWPLGVPRPTRSAAAAAAAHEHVRLTARHFCEVYPEQGKPDCVVCSDRTAKRRKQTTWRCIDCDLPMCPGRCFRRYHTLVNYRIAYTD